MNYKKIFQSRTIRYRILRLFNFIPDKIMISFQYWLSFGRILHIKNPKRLTEKIQWYKLYYRDPNMVICSDKYLVREYVKAKGYTNLIIPLYKDWDNANDIDFDELPKKFVIKTNNGSHTNVICYDKENLDYDEVKSFLAKQLSLWKSKMGREWAYYDIPPKIICEKLLEDSEGSLIDYKFFCYNGKAEYLYVITDRFSNDGLKCGIFDLEFNQLKYKREDIELLRKKVDKPSNFQEMIYIAENLSSSFPFVRVDLYNLNGKIYFGELTFYNGSGYKGYVPDNFDFIAGSYFDLPARHIK